MYYKKPYPDHQWQRAAGLSMVELLVAVALGLFLLAGIIQLFINNKQTFTSRDALARMQENARYALYLLTSDIRMAGYEGCRNISKIAPTVLASSPPANLSLTNSDYIRGYEGLSGSWSPALPTWFTSGGGNTTSAQTDVIVIRKASATSIPVTADMTSLSSNLTVSGNITFQTGDILFISDCQSADVFRASTGTTATSITHTTANNSSANLTKTYLGDAQVSRYELYAYYIKPTGRTNNAGRAITALFRQDANGTEEELVEGIQNMQITYGVDTNNDGTADTYQTADAVETNNNWGNIVGVKIALLVNSVDDVTQSPIAYTFNGSTITPTDRMLHKTWNTYINLRGKTSL